MRAGSCPARPTPSGTASTPLSGPFEAWLTFLEDSQLDVGFWPRAEHADALLAVLRGLSGVPADGIAVLTFECRAVAAAAGTSAAAALARSRSREPEITAGSAVGYRR